MQELSGKVRKKRVIYYDRGISEGMKYGIKNAKEIGQKIEYRKIPNYERFLKKTKNYF